jgi:hypothetical protein
MGTLNGGDNIPPLITWAEIPGQDSVLTNQVGAITAVYYANSYSTADAWGGDATFSAESGSSRFELEDLLLMVP